MKQPIHVRIFNLRDGGVYYADGTSFEDFVTQELLDGYVITNLTNMDVEYLYVITSYLPQKAKLLQDGMEDGAGYVVSNLKTPPVEEV